MRAARPVSRAQDELTVSTLVTRHFSMAPVALSSSALAPVHTYSAHHITPYHAVLHVNVSWHLGLYQHEARMHPSSQRLDAGQVHLNISSMLGHVMTPREHGRTKGALSMWCLDARLPSRQSAAYLGHVILAGLAQVIVEAPVANPARLLCAELISAGWPVVSALNVRQQACEHPCLSRSHIRTVSSALCL